MLNSSLNSIKYNPDDAHLLRVVINACIHEP